MKRIIGLFMAGWMALSLGLACTADGAVIQGDVDGDGQIAAVDLTVLARRVGGIDMAVVTLAETEESGADVDGNGGVDAADLTKLARHVGCIEAIGTQPLPYVELEYEILQERTWADMSGHVLIPGVFGPNTYYGSAYQDIERDQNGMLVDPPKECVLYTLSPWPDIFDFDVYVTEIVITDPSVTVMGLTVNSDFEDFDRIMEEADYTIVYASDTLHRAEKDGVWYRLKKEEGSLNELRICAEVTNKDNIIN